jgi:hypothetical protein
MFAGNLRDLLLAAPAGARPAMGLDPEYRTGVKVGVVSETGQTVATTTIYPHEPQRRWDEAIAQLARLAREHRVELIAIGNGTASRETDRLGAELIRLHPELELTKVVVSEAGASVYSASAFASHELVTPASLEDFVDLVVPILQERGAYKRDYLRGTLREKLFARSRLGSTLPAPRPAATCSITPRASTIPAAFP